MLLKLVITVLVLLQAAPCLSHADYIQPDYLKISSMLFPETSSWSVLARNIDGDILNRIKPKLVEAYAKSKIVKGKESEGCSFIERAFSTEYFFSQGFYNYDADGDGITDIIYTGTSLCNEGNSTLIWFRRGDEYAIEQDVFWDVLTLRIKPGQPAQLATVSVGCCGSDNDEYYVGILKNIRMNGIRNVTTGTVFPEKQGKRISFVADKKEFNLRSAPVEHDSYDPDESAMRAVAVLGNILSRYLPGCTGQVIDEKNIENSKLWYFVSLDEKCLPLRTYISSNVSAGWVAAEDISLK